MTTPSRDIKLVWTQLEPVPDPQYGSPCARSSHGLSVVQSGEKLVLYGGEHVARTPIDTEAGWILDLSNNKWRRMDFDDSTKCRPPPRVAHAQAVHNDKDVYVFGGRQGITMEEKPLNDLWKLDCETETWNKVEPTNQAPEPRSFHKMVCINDSLYVFGGCGASGRLADLHRFDILTNTWHSLGTSPILRGRGGANLLVKNGGKCVGVVAGFAGEETADGHAYSLEANQWHENALELEGMRPRSVCVSGTFPSLGIALVVGGEVDPSHRGHEGAGCFENDVVVLDESNGKYIQTISSSSDKPWPGVRGWSDADTHGTKLYVFGGLAGDDANPKRLCDLWQCSVSQATE